jgi:Prasinovirus endonuclease VII
MPAKIYSTREREIRRAWWMRRDRKRNPQKYQSMEKGRRSQRRSYYKARYWSDPIWNLTLRTRARIRDALEGKGGKLESSIGLLGCTPTQFKQHIAALFLPGMSWENRSEWHIDHKIPICQFDLSTLEGQKEAFHYTNTQPLWALDNQHKGGRLVCP